MYYSWRFVSDRMRASQAVTWTRTMSIRNRRRCPFCSARAAASERNAIRRARRGARLRVTRRVAFSTPTTRPIHSSISILSQVGARSPLVIHSPPAVRPTRRCAIHTSPWRKRTISPGAKDFAGSMTIVSPARTSGDMLDVMTRTRRIPFSSSCSRAIALICSRREFSIVTGGHLWLKVFKSETLALTRGSLIDSR